MPGLGQVGDHLFSRPAGVLIYLASRVRQSQYPGGKGLVLVCFGYSSLNKESSGCPHVGQDVGASLVFVPISVGWVDVRDSPYPSARKQSSGGALWACGCLPLGNLMKSGCLVRVRHVRLRAPVHASPGSDCCVLLIGLCVLPAPEQVWKEL